MTLVIAAALARSETCQAAAHVPPALSPFSWPAAVKRWNVSGRVEVRGLARLFEQDPRLGVPAKRLALTDFVRIVLGVAMLFDMDILARRDLEDVGSQRA